MLHHMRINEMEGQEASKAEALCQELSWDRNLSLRLNHLEIATAGQHFFYLLTVSISALLLTLQGRQGHRSLCND